MALELASLRRSFANVGTWPPVADPKLPLLVNTSERSAVAGRFDRSDVDLSHPHHGSSKIGTETFILPHLPPCSVHRLARAAARSPMAMKSSPW